MNGNPLCGTVGIMRECKSPRGFQALFLFSFYLQNRIVRGLETTYNSNIININMPISEKVLKSFPQSSFPNSSD